MTARRQFQLMASYNSWMNAKVYEACARLSDAELTQDRGAFFGSIFNTLNHLCVGDTSWLKRFAAHFPAAKTLDPIRPLPAPGSLTEPLAENLAQLRAYRQMLDSVIEQWMEQLDAEDLQGVLRYNSMTRGAFQKPLDAVLMHFFNHQTHHRGQVSTLLFQAGHDIGGTDLILLIDES